MDAKKCDRCGEYYQLYSSPRVSSDSEIVTNEKTITDKTIRNGNRIQILAEPKPASFWDIYDLCPECMCKQIMFLKGTDIKEE